MTRSDAELMRSGYDAFASGDVPAVFALFAENITWHVGGRNPLAGRYTGHDEVMRFFEALAERSQGTFRLAVHEILDGANGTVVALVTETAERNGARLDASAVHVWQMQDDRATTFHAFMEDDYAVDTFWS
jgi:uncharacterized protein